MASAQEQSDDQNEPVMSDEARKEWCRYLAVTRSQLVEQLYRQGREDGAHTRDQVRIAIARYEEAIAKRPEPAPRASGTGRAWASGSLVSSGAVIAASSLQGVGAALPSLGALGAVAGALMMVGGWAISLLPRKP
jgi:hypothetical protein